LSDAVRLRGDTLEWGGLVTENGNDRLRDSGIGGFWNLGIGEFRNRRV
jgi:hypothetical protein